MNNSIEYCLGKAMFSQSDGDISFSKNLKGKHPKSAYDLDLLYVECRFCGKPVLWEQGKTSLLLQASGIDTTLLDAECMLLADGCPNCQPGKSSFQLHVVRVAAFAPEEAMLLQDNRGTA